MFSTHHIPMPTTYGGVNFLVDSIQTSIDNCRLVSNVSENRIIPFSIFPLGGFRTSGRKTSYFPQHETRLNVYPIHDAAARGKEDVVSLLIKSSLINDVHQDASPLSLALYYGNYHVAQLLLNEGAHPGCGQLITSLHAAARLGLKKEIEMFVKIYRVDVDVKDKDGATPVVHALQLPEDQARETIRLLFELGADPGVEIGEQAWTYSALARVMGMRTLADELADGVLEEIAEAAADDRSSCTMDFER